MSIKNIFFPTDFSGAADKAFLYALLLAEAWEATITTFHVYHPVDRAVATHMPITMRRIYESIELGEFENYRDHIPELRQVAENNGFGEVAMQHVMVESEAVIDTILAGAEKEKADFIVMGTTGARGLKEIFLGSVAGEVLARAACPVLAVPERSAFDGRLDRIAFTTNYQEEEKRALDQLIGFAEPFDAEIYCINVDTGHTHFYHQRMNKLREEYRRYDQLHFEVLDGVDIIEEITRYLETRPIDILAMVTHRRTFLQQLFNYSKAKQMAYHASTPILSFPAEVL
jgi:nucleotide-binding universal stress UspA family protein